MSNNQVEFKLRLPERLRDRLAKAASDTDISMNTGVFAASRTLSEWMRFWRNMSRKPYNPASSGPRVHDRRARRVSRGALIVEAEVDDPRAVQDRNSAIHEGRPARRSLRPWPYRFAQFAAGGIPEVLQIAERGPQGDNERTVDGSPLHGTSPTSS